MRRGNAGEIGRGGGPWTAALLVIGCLAVAPVTFVAVALASPSVEVWRRLWRTTLPEMIGTTLALAFMVAVGSAVVGVGLAWLVTAYRFPGRDLFAWLLALPLAVPGYVIGFVFLSMVGPTGVVQRWWRGTFGAEAWFPEVRSIAGLAVVLVLVLYPYVYLVCRAHFAGASAVAFEVARTLGRGRPGAFFGAVLPMARPAVAAGVALVLMETLTDFATVQYFGVETVSAAVYRVWRGAYDRDAAAELAGMVLVFAVGVIGLERALRGRARYAEASGVRAGIEPTPLAGWRAAAALSVSAVVFVAGFGAPVGRLLWWALEDADRVDVDRFVGYLANTLWLASATALVCVAVALVVANALRFSPGRLSDLGAKATLVGYAVPAPVVAIGVLLALSWLDSASERVGFTLPGLTVSGSVAAVLYGYAVRFVAVGVGSVESNLERVPLEVTMSARALGARPVAVAWRVHLPLLRAGVASAAALVAMEAIKELPIVLLLRPFGFDTLSVWTWQLAGESLFRQAALPSLTIVASSVVAVFLLVRNLGGGPARSGRGPSQVDVPWGEPGGEVVSGVLTSREGRSVG
ncbi:MAG: ABC transporter permease [Acidimicrobiales bacterium]|nr:MAG: ABC transporter permease [Acidimicrobiales bacterium]